MSHIVRSANPRGHDFPCGSRGEELDLSISGPLLPPKAVVRADMPGRRVRANRDRTQRSKIRAYSITSSARASSVGGMSRPSAFAEIEQAVAAAAGRPHGGIVVLPHTITEVHRDLIIVLAARFHLPSMHAFPTHPIAGALASYGIDVADHFRPAADYIDRILSASRQNE
jgi:hypothetical protein